jgi:hypothetical protein
MNVAEILRESGLVPIVPSAPREVGTPQTLAASHTAIVPTVPSESERSEAEAVEHMHFNGEAVQLRAALFKLADARAVDPAHVRGLDDDGLSLLASMDLEGLRGYLRAAHDTATRQAGKVPAGDTAAISCVRCGPVFVHPAIAECLPVVDSWPRALGCPWCFICRVGGFIPRPPVFGESAMRCAPDAINPVVGTGASGVGKCARHPTQPHKRAIHMPENPA